MPNDHRTRTVRIGARDLSKAYGPVRANQDVTFSVAPREIHAVVGENGAGKSTLMRLLQGLEVPDAGTVILNDESHALSGPQDAFSRGIGMVHQEFMLADELTLLENLVLGDEPRRSFGRIDWARARNEAQELEARAGIAIDWDRPTASAPVHIRQYVEILRLLRRGSDVLILDEPTAVLAPQQVERLFTLLRQLRDDGTTIIFISHKLGEIVALADRVTIMRRGRTVASAGVDELDVAAMTRHIMGTGAGTLDVDAPKTPSPRPYGGEPVLRVAGLTTPPAPGAQRLSDITFDVWRGEIVGVAGIAGNGQDELLAAIAGLHPVAGGTVMLDDADVTGLDNAAMRAASVGYVSPDRAHEGLAREATIADNVIVGSQNEPALRYGPLRAMSATAREATARLAQLDVRYATRHDPVSSLSGGNQQKLVFARETARDPALLIVSQPTRGVDLNGIAAIHAILLQQKAAGRAVLLASEELDELIALSDRIVVLCEGCVTGIVPRDEADTTTVGRLMLGMGANGPEPASVAHG